MSYFEQLKDGDNENIAYFNEEAFPYIQDWMLEEVYLRKPVSDDIEAKNESSAYLELKIDDLQNLRNWVEDERLVDIGIHNLSLEEWMEKYKDFTLNSIDAAIHSINDGYGVCYKSKYRF